MKKFLLTVLLSLFAVVGQAQETQNANFTIKYDADSTNATYCRVTGQQGNPFNAGIPSTSTLTTSGSSTTVTEAVSGALPFAPLSVGDIITVRRADQSEDIRVVVAKASGASITVDTAVDWSAGFSFTWRKTTCGTTATDGWINVEPYAEKTLVIEYNQGDVTLDVRWECKASYVDANPVVVYPGETDGCGTGGTLASGYCQFLTAGVGITNRLAVVSFEPWSQCRVGFKVNGADASDAGANLESITIGLIQRLRR